MPLTPEEQARADEIARLLKEYDAAQDAAAVAAFQKALEDARESQQGQ